MGVLYVVDSVTRKWLEQAKAQGQTVNSSARDGTFAAGVHRVTELMPVLMNDIFQTAPDEHKVRTHFETTLQERETRKENLLHMHAIVICYRSHWSKMMRKDTSEAHSFHCIGLSSQCAHSVAASTSSIQWIHPMTLLQDQPVPEVLVVVANRRHAQTPNSSGNSSLLCSHPVGEDQEITRHLGERPNFPNAND